MCDGLSRSGVGPQIRQVTEVEADQVTELFTLAFYDDPTWGRAFPDPREPAGATPSVVRALHEQRGPVWMGVDD